MGVHSQIEGTLSFRSTLLSSSQDGEGVGVVQSLGEDDFAGDEVVVDWLATSTLDLLRIELSDSVSIVGNAKPDDVLLAFGHRLLFVLSQLDVATACLADSH